MSHEHIHTLPETLVRAHTSIKQNDTFRNETHQIDASITLADITDSFLKTIDTFAPFGMGNPKPLFEIRDVCPNEISVFGKTKNHTKLRCSIGNIKIDAICFFTLPEEFSVVPEAGKSHTLLAHIERSFFMGRLETRLRIVDII